MRQIGEEIASLRALMLEMMYLVKSQLEKGQIAVLDYDKDMAHEITITEKKVNAIELEIDRSCENIFALQQPVAIDLRFVMAVFKINSDLERQGDNAVGIAKYLFHVDKSPKNEILEKMQFNRMYNSALLMFDDVIKAFEKEDSNLARKVFAKDAALNEINSNAATVAAGLIQKYPKRVYNVLYMLSIIRKLERIGDLNKNVAEEIIFYVDAKVLKHKKQQSSL